jgi:hypothetical protein
MLSTSDAKEVKDNKRKEALREFCRHFDYLALIKEITKCKDCNARVISKDLSDPPILIGVNRKVKALFYPERGDPIETMVPTEELCPIHQPKLEALNRKYADSGWW